MEPVRKTGGRMQAIWKAMRRLDAWVWGLLALLLGLALTAKVAHLEWSSEWRESNRVRQASADSVGQALLSQLRACEMLVRSMQSLFLASDAVSDREFATAFDNLHVREHLPSLQGLSFAERVEVDGGTHYVVRLVQPNVPSNDYLKGFDIGTQKESLDAANQSRDRDTVIMSAPLRLRQAPRGSGNTSGVVLRLPVFTPGGVPATQAQRRQRMRGSLGASFMTGALVEDALASTGVDKHRVVVSDVTDGSVLPLYGRADRLAASAQTRTSRNIPFAGRTWRVDLMDAGTATGTPFWQRTVLFGGLSSLLFGGLVWSVIGARRRALDLADAVGGRYRASEERFRSLNELLPTLVMLYDQQTGAISDANKVARDRLGIGTTLTQLSKVAPPQLLDLMANEDGSGTFTCETELTPVLGDVFWASVIASSIDMEGRPQWLMVATDTTEQRLLNERLSYQASHDALTHLPNRQAFEGHMKQLLASGNNKCQGLLFIDLDQFKLINDTSGHIAGDQLLVQLAIKMRQQLRDQDMLVRLGGDEFGVLLSDITSADQAVAAAERLRSAIESHVFIWDRKSYTISASIGGTVFRLGMTTLKELLAQVDTACYTAKDAGRNRVHLYADNDAASQTRRGEMEWVNRIRWALEEDRLLLAYQEIHSAGQSGHAPRLELLLRMRDEDGRLVLPGAFLPAAERYGLMPRLDRWVIDTAFANFDRLHPQGAALAMCSINLSAASLDEDGFPGYLLEMLRVHGVQPQRVMFEITETAAVRDLGRVAALIDRLHATGCRIALDDFGAGMSSFGYLKNLGIDTIKIDGAFVTDIERDAVSHSIVRAITDIGHQHGLDVVAEWVANDGQLQVLRELGVDYVQGFCLHQPELALFQQ